MTSLVGALLGRRFETSLRGLVALSKIQLQQTLESGSRRLLRFGRNVLPQTTSIIPPLASAGESEKLMLFSERFPDQDSGSGGGERKDQPLKLMDYNKLRWPSPVKSLRNYFFTALIQISFDKEFSMKNFLHGAEQVTSHEC